MKFYILKQNVASKSDTDAERAEPVHNNEPMRCEVCGQPITIGQWAPPYRIKIRGKIAGDFLFVDYLYLVISRRVVEAYRKANLKGILDFKTVEFASRNAISQGNEYFLAEIVRGGTRIDEEKSMVRRDIAPGQKYCEICQTGGVITSMKGVVINQATWTGEDIFYAKGLPNEIVVSEKFVDMVNTSGFTNANFDLAEEYKPKWIFD